MKSWQEGLREQRLAEAACGRKTPRTLKGSQRASGTIIGHISGRHHLLHAIYYMLSAIYQITFVPRPLLSPALPLC
jgi:hypothetical protein